MTNTVKPVTPVGGAGGRTVISAADIVDANTTMMEMAGELDCLRYQAADWEPATTQVLDDIGLQAGMRCLDVGSGVGAFFGIMLIRRTRDFSGPHSVAATARRHWRGPGGHR